MTYDPAGEGLLFLFLFGTGCGQYRSSPYRLDRKIAVTVFLGVIKH